MRSVRSVVSRGSIGRVAMHLGVALVVTWPLVLHLPSAIPLGIERSGTVPFFNLWTLRWNQFQAGQLFRTYWDAPIFHPVPGAFAFSDPQPLTGLAFAPISWLSGSPTLAYNLVVLAIFTMNGVGAARLARRVGVSAWPAALAGVLAQALPFVLNQIGVVQLTVLFPLFYLVDAVIEWATTTNRAGGLRVGIWLTVTFLTSSYYGLFAIVVVPIAALTFLSRPLFTRQRLLSLGAGAAVFVIVALPIALTQKHYTDPYPRSTSLIDQLSAQPVDYAHIQAQYGNRDDKLSITPLPFLRGEGGSFHALYPGTALLVLAVCGVALVSIDRRVLAFLVLGAVLSFALSFGEHLGVGSFNLYDVVREHVPGYASLRSPFRFAALVQVFLVPLAALSLGRLWRRPEDGGRVVAAALVVFAILELALPPLPLVEVPPRDAAWASFVADRPGTDAAAVVPFPSSGDADAYEPTTTWMLTMLDDPHPLANGYSGLFPDSYNDLERSMQRFPDTGSLDALRGHGVRWIVVMHSWTTPGRQQQLERANRLRSVHDDPVATVYELTS